MMTLMQNRVLHLVGIIAWMIVMLALFYGEPKANLVMWRNVIMGVTFHIMFTGANYFR
jgi:hypothetical protein